MCEVIPNREQEILTANYIEQFKEDGIFNATVNPSNPKGFLSRSSLKDYLASRMDVELKCEKCAGINAAASKECEWCGHSFEKKNICESCAGENDLIASKCEWCGNPMEFEGRFDFLMKLYSAPRIYSPYSSQYRYRLSGREYKIQPPPPPPVEEGEWSEKLSSIKPENNFIKKVL